MGDQATTSSQVDWHSLRYKKNHKEVGSAIYSPWGSLTWRMRNRVAASAVCSAKITNLSRLLARPNYKSVMCAANHAPERRRSNGERPDEIRLKEYRRLAAA
jgi:hypothetical protein